MNRMIKFAAVPAMAMMATAASGALAADRGPVDNAAPKEMRTGDAETNSAGERPLINDRDVPGQGRAAYEQRVPDNAAPSEARSGDAQMNSAGDRPAMDTANSGELRRDGETAELNKDSLRDMQQMGRTPATGSGDVAVPDNAAPKEMRSGDAEMNSAGERPAMD